MQPPTAASVVPLRSVTPTPCRDVDVNKPIIPDHIFKVAYAFRDSKVLLTAVEIGVFTALANGPMDYERLCNRVGLHERGGRDFLDALAELGLLYRQDDGCYRNSPEAEIYLVRSSPNYVGGRLDHLNMCEYPHWMGLARALQTGNPQFGDPSQHGALYLHPADAGTAIQAASGCTLALARALATRFPWRDYSTLIDIGSGDGCLPVQIAQFHWHISGGGFDVPAAGPVFNANVDNHGLSRRLRFHPGDFRVDPLPAADVLVMGRILHNWDLPTKKTLIAKAYAALPPGGALVVCDRLIDGDHRHGTAGLFGRLSMLVMSDHGFDYSAADCFAWMREAGFKRTWAEQLTADQAMVVGMK
jgi:hypothetical protein